MNIERYERDMKNIMMGAYVRNYETFEFEFVTNLTASEKITFINSIVDTIVGDNYNSLIRDIMFDHMVIQLFTNVGGSYYKNTDDKIDAIEQFLAETNIIDIVKANMEIGLLDELNNAVDKAIEYRTGIHPSPIADSLASLISTLERKINEVDLGSAMEMVQKFVGMTGEFTPEALVNAYMNSDFHQKNLEEIDKSKQEKIEIAENLDKAIKIVNEDAKTKATKSKNKKETEKEKSED